MKIRPEKKFRPVRNNKNNSILAKFATYDGFMVKKKTCFSQFIKPTVKNANFICRISPQAKPNLLAALQNVSVKHRYNYFYQYLWLEKLCNFVFVSFLRRKASSMRQCYPK